MSQGKGGGGLQAAAIYFIYALLLELLVPVGAPVCRMQGCCYSKITPPPRFQLF